MICSVRRTWYGSAAEEGRGEGVGSVGCGGRAAARAREGTTAAAMAGGGGGGERGRVAAGGAGRGGAAAGRGRRGGVKVQEARCSRRAAERTASEGGKAEVPLCLAVCDSKMLGEWRPALRGRVARAVWHCFTVSCDQQRAQLRCWCLRRARRGSRHGHVFDSSL